MVVGKDGKLAGIITDADLRRLVTEHNSEAFELKAGDVMTADCKKIRADALAAEATAIFHKYRIDELPVVDADNRPLGPLPFSINIELMSFRWLMRITGPSA